MAQNTMEQNTMIQNTMAQNTIDEKHHQNAPQTTAIVELVPYPNDPAKYKLKFSFKTQDLDYTFVVEDAYLADYDRWIEIAKSDTKDVTFENCCGDNAYITKRDNKYIFSCYSVGDNEMGLNNFRVSGFSCDQRLIDEKLLAALRE